MPRADRPSQIRAGRLLGRGHAALGQHELSIAAFDAALVLANSLQLLWSEFLIVRGRTLVGAEARGASGHWSEETAEARLAEVVARMGREGKRAVLEGAVAAIRR